jgi:predicted small lipoprotein YifL
MTLEAAGAIDQAGRATLAVACAAALALAGCGGSGNPLDNPPTVQNATTTSGQKLSFVYFQKCVQPIFLKQLQINQNGVISTNTCAAAGCHDNVTGTGGALRLLASAQAVDMSNPANTADVIRATDMYKNFYSAQGSAVIGSPTQSRLLAKPLTLNVLHGGGVVFADQSDPNAKLIAYWIGRPMPQGQDEFSSAADTMFTPPNPTTGTCNSQ